PPPPARLDIDAAATRPLGLGTTALLARRRGACIHPALRPGAPRPRSGRLLHAVCAAARREPPVVGGHGRRDGGCRPRRLGAHDSRLDRRGALVRGGGTLLRPPLPLPRPPP